MVTDIDNNINEQKDIVMKKNTKQEKDWSKLKSQQSAPKKSQKDQNTCKIIWLYQKN